MRTTSFVIAFTLVACTQSQDLGDKSGDGSQSITPAPSSTAPSTPPPSSGPDGGAPTTATSHVVLYGGADDSGTVGDTWTFDGTAWTKVTTTGATPGVRSDAYGAALNGKVVLFGGFGGSGTAAYQQDTWSWDGASWTQLATSGPPARGGNTMTSLGSNLIMFGADRIAAIAPAPSDAWLWNGTSWSMLFDDTGMSVDGYGAATLNGVAYFLSGQAVISASSPTAMWGEKEFPGGPKDQSGAALATLGNNIVYFGGEGQVFAALDDTWTYDGTNWTLHSVDHAPPGRFGAKMATLGNKVVLFGGEISQGLDTPVKYLGDTWTWDGTTWTEVTGPGPSAREPGILVGY